jgi:hypothetical protein
MVQQHRAVSRAKHRDQANLEHLVRHEQFLSLQTLKFLQPKTWSFQIRLAKARWQVLKLQMLH